MSVAAAEVPADVRPAWKLDWLTPVRCRVILVALILFGAVSHVLYLNSKDALMLAPDEAQYWVWSQHLDWSYYSKGPMVALLIRASTSIFGDTMPAVRYPAILIGVVMTLLTYWLTRKLFRSEKLALGSVALTHFVPMYIAGSILMTIDPPYVLCWSAATCFFFKAILDEAKWAWLGVGAMLGLGFLAKYFAPVLYVGILIGLLFDGRYRHHLKYWQVYAGVVLMGLFTLPVVYWNWRHDWATLHHVEADISNGFSWSQPFEFIGGQVGIVGPFLCVLVVAAVRHAFRAPPRAEWPAMRKWRRVPNFAFAAWRRVSAPPVSDEASLAKLLACPSLLVLAIVAYSSFTTNAQLNWTAPAWFGLFVVTAWFLSTRMASPKTWKPWRGFVWATVVFGLVIMPVAHHLRTFWPAIAWFQTNWQRKHVRVRGDGGRDAYVKLTDEQKKNYTTVRKFDPTCRLLGWDELVKVLEEDRFRPDSRGQVLGRDAFYLTDDYAEASELEFYGVGQLPTYIMGQYVMDPRHRGRRSQWDMWPERSVERGKTGLIGRNALYVGSGWADLSQCFEHVEQFPVAEIYVRSGDTEYHIGGYRVWACYGFKGFVKPPDGKRVD